MSSFVITGASRGLGYEFLRQLSANPKNVVVGLVRNKEATEAALVKDNIKNVIVIQADITDLPSLEVAAEKTGQVTGGAVDCLINNAAYIPQTGQFTTLGDFNDKPEELERDLLDTFNANVIGVIKTVNVFIPMIRTGTMKKVIVISSGMADPDLINKLELAVAAPYSISKAAVNVAVAKYNALYKKENILFLAISPGLVDTGNNIDTGNNSSPNMSGVFQKYAPHFTGPSTPEESIKAVMSVIEKASIERGDGGTFVSHFGNKQWL